MSTADRFGRLEGGGELPGKLKKALDGLGRFENLEIGDMKPPPAQPKLKPDVLCAHCGQENEKERTMCWACSKPLAAKAAAAEHEIVIVLDGVTYKSSDPAVPRDVKALIDRILEEGYSPALLAQWREWRATRNVTPAKERDFGPAAPPEIGRGGSVVELFKGQRVAVMKIDGTLYTSDSADLSPEMKVLMKYINVNGVTPALLDYLRQLGHHVKYRPANTADPSDGEVAFWGDILQKQGMRPDTDKGLVQRQVAEAAARRILGAESAKGEANAWGAVAAAVLLGLYLLAKLLL